MELGCFSLFLEKATQMQLCLFDGPDGNQESIRVSLTEQTDDVWHIYLQTDFLE